MLVDRTQEPQRWDDVPRPVYDPAERLRAMDADGVDISVLYPTVAGSAGETFARLTDPELERVCVSAYNDWLVDEWAAASARFVPQCILPLSSIDAAVAEVRRAVGRGHRGVILPPIPSDLRDLPHVNDAAWDPLWATCAELGVPLCFYGGAAERVQLQPHASYSPALAGALEALTRPVSSVFILINFLLSRILVRHPGLQVVFAESGIAWAAYVLEYADHQFEKDRLFTEYDLRPSEMFRRQCYLTAWYEDASLETRAFIGIDNITWCTNFPLATSTWPNTRATLARWTGRVPDDERRRLLWANAARVYQLDVQPPPSDMLVGVGATRTMA
jgi:predicted TIM-barrel fold metal-dependent hydrolase